VRIAAGRRRAALLGLLALALNALVPVHLAFDLVEAVAAGRPHTAHDRATDLERDLLALLSGHRDGAHHHHGKHRGTDCPTCNSLGSIAALAVPVAAALPLPAISATAVPAATSGGEAHRVAAASYRPRAPPLS